MATNFVGKMANSVLSLLSHSETEWDNAVYMRDLIAPLILETHHPGYRALRHVATGSSVKLNA